MLTCVFTFLLLLSLYLIGHKFLSRFFRNELSFTPIEIVLFSVGCGFGLVGTLVLILGWALPGNVSMKLNVLAAFLGLLVLLNRDWLRTISRWVPQRLTFSSFQLSCVVIGVLGLGLAFVASFSPITYYDSLVYHLALPKAYLHQGSIPAVSDNLYAYFPALTEMMFLFILEVFPYSEYGINLFSWSLSLLIGAGLAALAKKLFTDEEGPLAWALWASTPNVLFLSTGGYIEIPLAFFSFLSLWAFIWAYENKWNSKGLVLSGLFGGFACAVKYTGVITPCILFSYLSYFFIKKKVDFRTLLFFTAGVIVPVCPWLLKNAMGIGNPVFPFFYSFFGGDVAWTKDSAEGYFQVLTQYGSKSHVFLELLTSPFLIFSNAKEFGGGFDVLGDFGWSLFLLSAPFAIFFVWKKPLLRFLYIYSVLHFSLWFLTKPVLRFLLNLLPVAVLLTSAFFMELKKQSPLFRKGLIWVLFTPFWISHFFLIFFITDVWEPFSVSLGLESRDQFLRRKLSYYPLYEFINQQYPISGTSGKVAVLGDQRTYHLDVPYLCSNIFAPSLISRWANEVASTDEMKNRLFQNDVHYLILNYSEIQRLGGYRRYGFTEKGEALFRDFLEEKTRQITGDKNNAFFMLKE